MADVFNDFVPAGQDAGGVGDGFTDFVPAKEPVAQPEIKPTPKAKAEKVIKSQ